jgi:predicted nucleic acid-binding protein
VNRVLIDTGPIVAILSAADQHHVRCVAELADLRPPLLTCWPVVTEAQWLLRHDPRAVQALFHGFTSGLLALLPVDATAIPSMADFFRRYSKRKPDLADGMLVHLAERENIATIFTLDQRDFSIYRFGRNRHFKILPNERNGGT